MANESVIKRRRVPRREFTGRVGVLSHGRYHVSRALQIGEGGMLIHSNDPLEVGQRVVLNFRLPHQNPDAVTAIVRYVSPGNFGERESYGLEFSNLDFNVKRQIRNYVAMQSHLKPTTGESEEIN